MKHAIPVTMAILAAAGLLGWWMEGRLGEARASGEKLAAEAVLLGLPADGSRPSRSARPNRDELDAEAKRLAIAWLELPRARQRIVIPSREEASETEKRIALLDPRQRKVFLAGVLAAMESDPSIAADRVIGMLTDLARQDPRVALELFAHHHDVLKRELGAGEVISAAIDAWAKDDPLGAASWLKKHSPLFPEALSSQTTYNLFRAAAAKEPRMAFQLIATMGLDESASHDAVHSIVTAARTDETRNTTLAALRDCKSGKLGGDVARKVAAGMIRYFAWSFREEGFQATTRWLASANLDAVEMGQFLECLFSNPDEMNDESRWIDWLDKNASSEVATLGISRIMGRWTEQDYEAAGEWLRNAPESDGKSAAVLGYVDAIAPYLPDSATDWAMTLPSGDERDRAVKMIQHHLPKTNDGEKRAAEAFAQEHGIEGGIGIK